MLAALSKCCYGAPVNVLSSGRHENGLVLGSPVARVYGSLYGQMGLNWALDITREADRRNLFRKRLSPHELLPRLQPG
ncbi:unnamed protein product [Protopolystoma xenopodis]|uniref:Uncharacterized protein n=1 Tax=Protopolystoma xenopodis TaxID=117903 RepID=A0A448XHV5_9PLAT|nr:unnamed protein product [Protopolystoma xenopodis]